MGQVQPETYQSGRPRVGVRGLSDRDLVAEILRKDRKATAELVDRCADCVYGYVRHRLAPRMDLVEDVVQEIFLAAWQNLDKYRGDASLRSWLLGIARHKVQDHYRKRLTEIQLREEGEDPVEEALSLPNLDDELARRQAGQKVRDIMMDLPEIYSFALLWRYWEGRSLQEIAIQTGKTEKAIERILARARGQLRKRWNEQ
ncbi:MAG: RNA polymerase sigma factor [Gammaproteobacteria bacterium]